MNLTFVMYLEIYTQIKALQPPSSVLFQFKIIIIKSANKQGLIQSHSRVDESYTCLCHVKFFKINEPSLTAHSKLRQIW